MGICESSKNHGKLTINYPKILHEQLNQVPPNYAYKFDFPNIKNTFNKTYNLKFTFGNFKIKHCISHKPDKYATYTDYYLPNDHEPVISREVWTKTQQKLQEAADERNAGIYRGSGCHYLYGIVFCGDCGSPFRRRTLKHDRGDYHKAWSCRERLMGTGGNGCRCRTVSEKEILDAISRSTGIDNLDEKTVLSVVRKIVITDSEIVVQTT